MAWLSFFRHVFQIVLMPWGLARELVVGRPRQEDRSLRQRLVRRKEQLLLLDSDGQHLPEEISRFLDTAASTDASSSSGSSEVARNPSNSSLAGIVLVPRTLRASTVPSSAANTTGSSAAGSA